MKNLHLFVLGITVVETGSYDIFTFNQWAHVCMALDRKASHVQVVQVNF